MIYSLSFAPFSCVFRFCLNRSIFLVHKDIYSQSSISRNVCHYFARLHCLLTGWSYSTACCATATKTYIMLNETFSQKTNSKFLRSIVPLVASTLPHRIYSKFKLGKTPKMCFPFLKSKSRSISTSPPKTCVPSSLAMRPKPQIL